MNIHKSYLNENGRECPYLKMILPMPMNPRSANMDYRFLNDRLLSFKSWSHSEKIKAEQLARGGFTYTERGDKYICNWCGLVLFNWQYLDDVISEHKHHVSKGQCQFLNMSLLAYERYM